MFRSLLHAIGSMAQPCLGCGAGCRDAAGICVRCRALLPTILVACRTCGAPLPGHLARCQACERHPPVLSQVAVSLRYEGLARDLVLALKYNNQLWAARSLAVLMYSQRVDNIGESVLVPVPSVAARMRSRGFSPALEITRCLARLGGWPMAPFIVSRRGYQPPQSSLESAAARERNVQNAFTVSRPSQMPATVCFVDDVLTTGATLRSLARCALANGARSVSAWVATRATIRITH